MRDSYWMACRTLGRTLAPGQLDLLAAITAAPEAPLGKGWAGEALGEANLLRGLGAPDPVEGTVLVAGVAYALGRTSASVSNACHEAMEGIGRMSPRQREAIRSAVSRALNESRGGMECDVAPWRRLLAALPTAADSARALFLQWHVDASGYHGTDAVRAHPNYAAIVAIGADAVPPLLDEVEATGPWAGTISALADIAGPYGGADLDGMGDGARVAAVVGWYRGRMSAPSAPAP